MSSNLLQDNTNTVDWPQIQRDLEQYNNQYSGCPACGYCPHCGRGGYHTYPYYPSYPIYPAPWYQPFVCGGSI